MQQAAMRSIAKKQVVLSKDSAGYLMGNDYPVDPLDPVARLRHPDGTKSTIKLPKYNTT